MIRYLSILFLHILLCNICTAQSSFFRTYGGTGNDFGESVILTSDSSYIVVGATESFGNGVTDLYVFKVDSLGNYIWSKTFGGPNIDYGKDVIETENNNYILCGYSNINNNGYDVFIVVIDSSGNHNYTKTIGGNDWDFAYSISKLKTPNKYIVAGETYSYGSGNSDAYLIMLDTLGDTLWTKTYGGIGADKFSDVIVDDSNNIICIGSTSSSTLFNDSDIWIVKTDSNGLVLWEHVFSDTLDDFGKNIYPANNGSYFFAGDNEEIGHYDIYYGNIASNGIVNYSKNYVGPADEISSALVQHADSNTYTLIGNTTSYGNGSGFYDVVCSQRNTVWTSSGLLETNGTALDDISNNADTTFDNSIIIVGTTYGTINGMSSAFLMKIDSVFDTPNILQEDIDLSIENSNKNDILIYPNPALNKIYVSNSTNSKIAYIWNLKGQLILKKDIDKNKFIDVSNLKSGVYIISLDNTSRGRSFLKL